MAEIILLIDTKITSLNSNTNHSSDSLKYLQFSGFNYYDNNKYIKNNIFGDYNIISNDSDNFSIKYTINNNRLWSDGAKITSEDLLLYYIISSSSYSISAGLGDPKDNPVFSINYYNDLDFSNITIDALNITVKFTKYINNWELFNPSPFPVHTLVNMYKKLKNLPILSPSDAKKFFSDCYYNKTTSILKEFGNIWNNYYNILTIDINTDPLLLVCNGGYQINSLRTNTMKQECILSRNISYNSGPPITGNINTIKIQWDTDALNTILNQTSNMIYTYFNPSLDQINQIVQSQAYINKTINMSYYNNNFYEHIDLRVGSSDPTKPYLGPFNGLDDVKATDLRKAFLLAYPRQQIITNIIQPINPNASIPNTIILPGIFEKNDYNYLQQNNGSNFYSGTQNERIALALSIVQKYYPLASSTNPVININVLWGGTKNTRRKAQANLIITELGKAGFNINAPGSDKWGSQLFDNNYDAQFFTWVKNNHLPTNLFETKNNRIGLSNPKIDTICNSITNSYLTPLQLLNKIILLERIIYDKAISLPLFWWPQILLHSSSLQNIKYQLFNYNIINNYWEWNCTNLTTTPPLTITCSIKIYNITQDKYNGFTINCGDVYNWNYNGSINGTITINQGGILNINQGGILNINQGGILNINQGGILNINSGGIIISNGSIIISNSSGTSINNTGTMNINGSSTIENSGTGIGIYNSGNINIGGSMTIYSTSGMGIKCDNGIISVTRGSITIKNENKKNIESIGLYNNSSLNLGGSGVIYIQITSGTGININDINCKINIGTNISTTSSITTSNIKCTLSISSQSGVGIYNNGIMNILGGNITVSNSGGTGINNQGTMNLMDGIMTISNSGLYGIINLSNGSMNIMSGSMIISNSKGMGFSNSGIMNIFGGNTTILNSGIDSKGIYCDNGIISVTGGSISLNNTLTSSDAIGIYNNSSLNLSGSSVININNRAGNGIYISNINCKMNIGTNSTTSITIKCRLSINNNGGTGINNTGNINKYYNSIICKSNTGTILNNGTTNFDIDLLQLCNELESS
jgi:peptide/nickel transport system substrate-binding protein